MSFCMKGEVNKSHPKAIPIITVDSKEDAKSLQVYFCKLSYDDRYLWHGFKGTLEDLNRVERIVKETYKKWQENKIEE